MTKRLRNYKDLGECEVMTIFMPVAWKEWIDKYTICCGVQSRSEFIRRAIRHEMENELKLMQKVSSKEEEMNKTIEQEGYVWIPRKGYTKIVRRLE